MLEPLLGLVSGLGEGVIWLIQSNLVGIDPSSIYIDVDRDEGIWSILGFAGGAIGGAALIAGILSLGPVAALVGGLGAIGAVGSMAAGAVGAAVGGTVVKGAVDDYFDEDFYLPIYAISPAEIFAGVIPALDVNFINPPAEESITTDDGKTVYNSAAILSPQISKWYVAIRNLVLVGLMVVLLYIGIRIVISSTAGEKAKYKEHIKDWLIAVVLVIFMHYIMAFAITMTQYVTNMLNANNEDIGYEFTDEKIQKIEEALGQEIEGNVYHTNLMGYARLEAQANAGEDGQFSWNNIGYTIIFLVLVIYTVMFLIIYLKRVIYMAFLTMIAPLVALTYPIDKISDGQAQAFNMWLKEYIYNLLLQPFHLLLYTMLVGSVMDLASENMIYAIVALGFLIPAEKLLRRFFGFDQKAPEAGSIVGGVVGGSMAMSAINNLRRIGSVGQRRNGGKPVSSGNNNGKARLVETNRGADAGYKVPVEDLLGRGNAESGNTPSGNNSNLDGEGTIRTATAPNVNPSMVGSENETNNAGNTVNLSEPFNPNSPYETIGSDDLKSNFQATRDWVGNLPPIRGINNAINERKNNFQDWLKETPKTARGRDAKRMAIRGARSLKAGAETALHYTAKGAAAIGKRAPRLMTKAALGATLGTAGVAAGIATGDWSNIAAYGAAAAGVGVSIGEGVSNVAGNIGSGTQNISRNMRDDYESRRYTKEERKARQNARADEEWRKNKDVIRMYKDAFGRDYRQAMDKALEYRKYGITDDKATIKSIESTGIDGAPSRQEIATTKISAAVKTEDELKETTDRLRKNGVSETTIRELEGNVRKRNISGGFV